VQQGGEGQKFIDPGPQFGGQFGVCLALAPVVRLDDLRPRNGQFSARAVGQFDPVAGFRVGRVTGTPQHFYNLVIERVVRMGHTHHSDIV
jgi:hypothetical protein